MEYDSRYLQGVEHFNRHEFYEAHDPWEALWLERFGEEKNFLQGLILCTVALHHYSRGNLSGARSRYRLAVSRLEGYPSPYWGVDLAHFLRRMHGTMYRLLTEEEPPALEARTVPELKLKA